MKKILLTLSLFTYVYSANAQSVPTDQFDSQVPRTWFSLELYLVKTGTGFTPPVASRAMGYTGLAAYQSVYKGIDNKASLASYLPQTPVITEPSNGVDYDWRIVQNNALADVIDSLFGNASVAQKDSIHFVKNAFNTQFSSLVSAQVYADSKALGEQIAKDVFAYSATDGGHKGYLSNTDPTYIPPTGPGMWVPTPPAYAAALQPHWGDVRTMVVENLDFTPAAPPVFSSDTNSAMYAWGHQVYTTVNNLTYSQENIAKYWADGGGSITPPGHSISILTNIMKNENENLEFASLAYAKLGMSQMDAFISCWKTKYVYNLMRPVTYIRAYIDSNWTSLIGTPPFPEYTSGHSTQSGAMTSVMNDLYGSTYVFTDSTHGNNYGGPRTFNCFDEAAYEAATSRLFGGIHYEFSDVLAISLGKSVGQNIVDLINNANSNFSSSSSLRTNTEISMYPNPTSNFVLLSNVGNNFRNIEVYDATGRLVLNSNNPYVLDLMNLSTGLYMVKVYDNDSLLIASNKVIKD
jgi:hypothetical protein